MSGLNHSVPWNRVQAQWNGCACMRTPRDFVLVDNFIVDTSNHSNICVCNFVNIMGCNFIYSTPVISYQLL